MQDQGHPQGRVPADVQRGKHDAAVAFAADHRALVPYGPGHVGLAHRSPDQPAPRRRAASSTTRLVERFTTTVGFFASLLRPSNTARTAKASV